VSSKRRNLDDYSTLGKVLSTFEVGAISLILDKKDVKTTTYLRATSSREKWGMSTITAQ
jgi:hypothetical protein